MKITINEREREITINEFVDKEEEKWFIEFMRVFSLLRTKYKKED